MQFLLVLKLCVNLSEKKKTGRSVSVIQVSFQVRYHCTRTSGHCPPSAKNILRVHRGVVQYYRYRYVRYSVVRLFIYPKKKSAFVLRINFGINLCIYPKISGGGECTLHHKKTQDQT